jgi:hypothetical protein
MKDPISSRRLVQKWHRRDKAAANPLAGPADKATEGNGRMHSPTTSTGLIVEDQIRKAWTPNGGGLPIF